MGVAGGAGSGDVFGVMVDPGFAGPAAFAAAFLDLAAGLRAGFFSLSFFAEGVFVLASFGLATLRFDLPAMLVAGLAAAFSALGAGFGAGFFFFPGFLRDAAFPPSEGFVSTTSPFDILFAAFFAAFLAAFAVFFAAFIAALAAFFSSLAAFFAAFFSAFSSAFSSFRSLRFPMSSLPAGSGT